LKIKRIEQKRVLIFWKIKSEDYLYKNLKLIINSNQQAIINYINLLINSIYNNKEEIENTIS
jgi:hypothetical protein